MTSTSNDENHSGVTLLHRLGNGIAADAASVSKYLQESGLPLPSYQTDAPPMVLPITSPAAVQEARQRLMSAALEMFHLASGPSEFLPHLTTNFHHVSCLQWLCRYNIFRLIPVDESISYADLAAAAKVRQHRLKSIVRMAMTTFSFSEHADGHRIRHSATSAWLSTNDNAHAYASYITSRIAPMSLSMTTAHEKWGSDSSAANETAYNVAFDTDLPFFEDLTKDKARMDEFAQYMRGVRSSDANDLRHLVAGLRLDNVRQDGSLVDVGGSTGESAIALATAHPKMRFVIQDLEEIARKGHETASTSLPLQISARLTFQPHDFMLPQPVKGADAYLLRMIIHDWPDERARVILSNIAAVMDPKKSRLFVMDTVLPVPGSFLVSQERVLRAKDLTMMLCLNSKERELNEWKELFDSVEPRLEVVEVRQGVGSAMAVMELGLAR